MARPHSQAKAAKRVRSPDEEWAAEIARTILSDAHPWQADGIRDPSRRISFQVGRGGTKTTTLRARAIIKVTSLRNQYVGYAATTADQARDLNWNKLQTACEALKIRSTTTSGITKAPDVSFLDAKMIMTCHRTGSIYRLRGVEDRRDAERFRGFPQAEFQVDESGSFPPELLEYLVNTCVAPRLGEAQALDLDYLLEHLAVRPNLRGGVAVLAGTPPAILRGEFYEVTRDGSKRHRPYAQRKQPEYKDWKGYSSHAWSLLDVVSLPKSKKRFPALVALWDEALIEKAEKGWSDDHPTWLREYCGKWSADNTATVFRYRPHLDGKPWNEWDPFGDRPLDGLAALKVALEALPKDVGEWRHVVSMDMGSRDPFALNVYSFAPRDPRRRIVHTFAFERQGMYARPIAEMLIGPELDHQKLGGIVGLIGWPDGMVIDADQNTIDELSNVYGIRCRKADRNRDYKYGAVELVNGDLVDGRIWIIKGSPLARQIAVLQWKPDEFGNPREDKAQANHSTDTLIHGRKLIAHLFDTGTVAQETKAIAPVYVDPMGLDGVGEDPGEEDPGYTEADPEYGDSWGND